MGRLRTVSLILILGAWGGATEGAGPDDAAATPSSATRQPPPAPPIKYLETGARLFNSGDNAKLELASKYLEAANSYRDQLQPDEQVTLDAYLKELANVKAVIAASERAAPAAGLTAAAPAAGRPPASPTAASKPAGPIAAGAAAQNQITATVDTKQRGRWLLHEAREQLHLGNYDMAQRKAQEADAMAITWGLFDDTPAKVVEEINKARPKAGVAKATASGQPHDRRAAKAKLREARNALASRQFEQAEAVAIEVKGWGLNYGLFEDNPDKVAAAARALRRRDKIRNTSPKEQPSQGVYDILVQQSRQLIAVGRLDEAEAKARQAQRMNVVPSLTAERAESVLHEIAMARAQKVPAIATTKPAPEPPSVVAEREANELLAKGDQAAAVAKFTEVERLSAGESTRTATAGIALTPEADPAVRQMAANEPAPTPDLAAPADEPAAHQPAARAPAARRRPCQTRRSPVRRPPPSSRSAAASGQRQCQTGQSGRSTPLRGPGPLQDRQLPGS